MSKRKLTLDDAIDIWIRRWLKHERHQIIRDFDQNPMRIYEVWQEETFKGSREEAEIAFRTKYPRLVRQTDFAPHKKARKLVRRAVAADTDPRQRRLL